MERSARSHYLPDAKVDPYHAHLRNEEGRCAISASYLDNQPEINEEMRAILVDWLVTVHHKFKLKPETLFLTVNVIDRFIERTVVGRSKFQLAGVTALLLACKYVEIYPPMIKELVYMTDGSCNRTEVGAQAPRRTIRQVVRVRPDPPLLPPPPFAGN
jgi:hypothetical protein